MMYSSLEEQRNSCCIPEPPSYLPPTTCSYAYAADDKLLPSIIDIIPKTKNDCFDRSCSHSLYEQTKTFTPSLSKSSPSSSLPSSPPTSPSVTFNLEMNTIHRYGADASELPPSSCGSSSSSWRSAVRISAYSSVMACRQELVEAAADNIAELRDRGGNQGYNAYGRYVDHLISAIAVRKHHAQMQTRKEAIQSVLEEQDRQRRCNHFDPMLIAKTSRQHSMIPSERALKIGYTLHESESRQLLDYFFD